MNKEIEDLIGLIETSQLDQTIKDILVRDLKAEGLTDFLREQIKAYCLDGIKKIDDQIAVAQKILDQNKSGV